MRRGSDLAALLEKQECVSVTYARRSLMKQTQLFLTEVDHWTLDWDPGQRSNGNWDRWFEIVAVVGAVCATAQDYRLDYRCCSGPLALGLVAWALVDQAELSHAGVRSSLMNCWTRWGGSAVVNGRRTPPHPFRYHRNRVPGVRPWLASALVWIARCGRA